VRVQLGRQRGERPEQDVDALVGSYLAEEQQLARTLAVARGAKRVKGHGRRERPVWDDHSPAHRHSQGRELIKRGLGVRDDEVGRGDQAPACTKIVVEYRGYRKHVMRRPH
jgi:hypothetical protein